MLRNTPIRRKFTLIILGISFAVMFMMRVSFFLYEFITFRETMARHVNTLGEVLAANSTAALAFANVEDAQETLSALATEPQISAAAIYDQSDRLFVHYPVGSEASLVPVRPEAPGHRFAHGYLVSFQPVVQGDRRLGTLFIRYDTGEVLAEFLRGSLYIALGVMAVVAAIAYSLSRLLQGQFTRPLLSLASTSRVVAERGDYSVRAVKHGNDEIGQLTDSFNHMLARLQDLTQDLEFRVRQRTAQLEAANKELEAFSYSVSHDLRAPLRHIDGFAGLLEKSDGAALSPRGHSHLHQIKDSAKQMGMLVDDLLVFARMGRAEMRIMPVNLAELADEVIEGLKPETQQRNLRWIRGPLPTVQGDRPMLRQVLVNLFSNAVKYSRQRDPAVIEYGFRTEGTDYIVFVRDNGVGFDMKYAAKLFGVFQRLHRAEEFEGTGIGLANVQRIVNRHGGRVWADAQPDAGATFHFSLPQPKATATAP